MDWGGGTGRSNGRAKPAREAGTPRADGDPGARRRRAVLAVGSLAAFMAFLDMTIVNVAFPDIQASFPDAPRSELSWVLNAYNIVFAALLMPAGWLADLIGRRRLFLIGVALFTLTSLLCAAAVSPETLIAARVGQAAGAAAVIPTMVAILLAEFPPERRVHAVAVVGTGAAVAAGAGPPVGGLLIELWDWRAVFIVNLPVGVATYFWARRLLTESRDPDHGAVPDVPGILLLVTGMAAFVLGVVKGNEWGWTDSTTLATFAAATVLIPLALVRSQRHPSGVIDLSLVKIRSVRSANVALALFAASAFGKLLLDVFLLIDVWGYKGHIAGLALALGPLLTAISAPFAGKLATRYGARKAVTAGALMYCAGSVWLLTQSGSGPEYLAVFLPNSLLTGVANALALPTLTSAGVMSLPPSRYAMGSALNAMARQLGGVIGVAVVVAIAGSSATVATLGQLHEGWVFTALAALASACAALTLGGREHSPHVTASPPIGTTGTPSRAPAAAVSADSPAP